MDAEETVPYGVSAIEEVADDIAELDKFYFEYGDGLRSVERFEAALHEALGSLGLNPRINPKWNDMDDVRRYNMFTHKVAIIYVIDDDRLEVIAVKAFHSMQNPETTRLFIEQRLSDLAVHKGNETA
jgi:plasmid stabilization system protein ParE